jgi:hypothetical protein
MNEQPVKKAAETFNKAAEGLAGFNNEPRDVIPISEGFPSRHKPSQQPARDLAGGDWLKLYPVPVLRNPYLRRLDGNVR